MSTLREKLQESQDACGKQQLELTKLRTTHASLEKKSKKTEDKLRIIRALYMLVYNDERSALPLSLEMFHMLGEVLEGVSPKDLDLHLIDKDALIAEVSSNTH